MAQNIVRLDEGEEEESEVKRRQGLEGGEGIGRDAKTGDG